MPAPKITTTVDDQSTRVTSTSSYNTAIVIEAKKGPIDTPIKVTGQTDYLRRFTPNERYELGWDLGILEAYRYLEDQSGLYVVRCAHITDEDPTNAVAVAGCKFAIAGTDALNITFKNTEDYINGMSYNQFNSLEQNGDWNATEQDACVIYASSAGAYGNDLSVEIVTDESKVKLPGAFLIYVYNKDILKETFTCSLDPSLKSGYGVNCSIDKVLQSSQYIRGCANPISDYITGTSYEVTVTVNNTNYTAYTNTPGNKGDLVEQQNVYETKYCNTKYTFLSDRQYSIVHTGRSDTYYKLPKPGTLYLTCGNDGSAATSGDRIRALKTLGNMNDISIQLIMDGGVTTEEYHNAIRDLCDKRDDSCHGIISTSYEDEVSSDSLTAIRNYRKYQLNMNSYSMEMYTPHQKYYDEFNDRYVWLSPGPYVCSLIMQTAQDKGWHWAVAGYNRGVVPSIDVSVAFDTEIVDELSDMQVNTIIKDPGAGNIIWDELTLWSQASDLQDAHISRWINIYLRPQIKEFLKSFLFEFNDQDTRDLLIKKLETFMEPQKSARACYAYRIVCDESNNSDSDVENNICNCWLYVKPTKICKWINQKIILTPYSTDLESIEL